MLPSIAAALLFDLDSNDSDHEVDDENESNHFLYDEDDSELSMNDNELSLSDIDTMDTSTIHSSYETDELEESTVTDDNDDDGDDSSAVDTDDVSPESVDYTFSDNTNEDVVQPSAKRFKPDTTSQPEETENVDPSQKCPICLGAWTSAGNHRLCSLRCGHLFGYKCIEQWLKKDKSTKRCPQCNTAASLRHIRFLYANKLTSTDCSELERVNKKVKEMNEKCVKLSEALNKEKKRTRKYKNMYKARTLALTVDSDFCFSD